MEYALLTILALTIGAGVAGGVLSAWSCHRRVLALEENCKLYFTSMDDRMNQISKIITRQDKSAAATARWSKEDKAAAELAALMNKGVQQAHPWDPRTWGNSDGR